MSLQVRTPEAAARFTGPGLWIETLSRHHDVVKGAAGGPRGMVLLRRLFPRAGHRQRLGHKAEQPTGRSWVRTRGETAAAWMEIWMEWLLRGRQGEDPGLRNLRCSPHAEPEAGRCTAVRTAVRMR